MSLDLDLAIDELRAAGRLQDVTVYAFGHTAATELLRRRLDRDGIPLAGVLDNNPAKQGGSLGGVPVIAPEQITALREPTTVLIAARFYEEMRGQLVDLGYAEERILRVGDLSSPSAAAGPADAIRGAGLLARLRGAHPARQLILCPFGALGDVYWALAYLPSFIASRGLAPAVPVVVGSGCRQVVELFGYAEAENLSQAEMDDIVAAVVAAPEPGTTIAHHDRPHGPDAPVRVLDQRLVPFTELYRTLVYRLPNTTQAVSPRRAAFRGGRGRLRAAGLPAGRTVLLAPHAKSVLPVADAFWQATAEAHAARGQALATLVHGDEQPVPGTAALEIELAQLLNVVEDAGTLIALRSGLCDVAHGARARKIAVSPDAYYSTTRHTVADFFALPGWERVIVPVL